MLFNTNQSVQLLFLLALLAIQATAVAQPTVNITLDDGDLAEAGQDPGGFTVTRTDDGTLGQSLDVFVDLAGTATNGLDYTIAGATLWIDATYFLTIQAESFSASVTVTPKTDNRVEVGEDIIWTLRDTLDDKNDYFLDGPLEVTLTIADDVAVVNLTLDDGDLAEAGQDPGGFTVTRSNNGAIDRPLDVFVDLAGTATNGLDYTISGATLWIDATYFLTIQAESFSASATVTPKTDNQPEGEETVVWTLRDTLDDKHDYFLGTQTNLKMAIRDFVEMIFKDSFEDPP